jgi:hypothetical protein
MMTTRLVVSPAGIEYHEPGYILFARWEDVDHTRKFWSWYWKNSEALCLRQSTVQAPNLTRADVLFVLRVYDK